TLKIDCTRHAVRVALAATCALPALAAAQATTHDTSANTAEAPQGLAEITVTAQKFAQSAQTVPLAISAFSADELENRQAFNLEDLKYLVPSLSLEQNLSN